MDPFSAVMGVFGLVGAAAVSGYFALRAQHQNAQARTAGAALHATGSEVQQALLVVSELVAAGREKDETIRMLQARLDDRDRRR